jgi:hypothetical protein
MNEPRCNFSQKRAKFNSGTLLALSIGSSFSSDSSRSVMHRHLLQFCAIAAFCFASFASTLQPTARAVDFGWKELPDGGIEYQVQVEPELISTFATQGFSSEIPPGLRDIRSIRITTGKAQLPNQGDLQGPKVVQAAIPEKTTPASDVADNSAQKSAIKEPNMLSNVVTTGATEAAPLLNPNDGNTVPALPYRYSPPLTSETNNGSASGSAFGSNPANGNPANSNPPNSSLPETNRIPGLNEAANPLKGSFWPNTSSTAKGEPTPAAVPPEAKSGFDPNPPRDNSAAVDTFRSENRYTVGAPQIGANELPQTVNKEISAPEAKPWMPLMLALLALFASLAANVYLVWLHQEIRFKYFSLLRRLPDGSVSTV